MTPPSGLEGPPRDLSESREGGVETVGEELDRNRRCDRLDELVRGGDDDEAVGGGGDDLLAGVRAAAALDDPAVGRDLIRSVDCDVEPGDAVERLDGKTK
jgi:hypothetical protein